MAPPNTRSLFYEEKVRAIIMGKVKQKPPKLPPAPKQVSKTVLLGVGGWGGWEYGVD